MAAKNMGSSMRIAMLIALPSCVGYFVLAHPMIDLLFAEDAIFEKNPMLNPALGGSLLRILALAIPCVALVGLSNAILQAIGQVRVPVLTMLLGGVCKIVRPTIPWSAVRKSISTARLWVRLRVIR